MAFLLHELIHLSQAGLDFLTQSRQLWHGESSSNNNNNNFYGSPYGDNLEGWANDIMIAIANAADLDITGSAGTVLPGNYHGGVSPQQLYDTRNP